MVLIGSNGLLKDIVLNLAICDWCGALPIQWNKSRSRLETKRSWKHILYKTRLVCAILYFSFVLLQVIHSWKAASLTVITHNVMFLSGVVMTISMHIGNHFQLLRVVELFNCFIDYEKRHIHEIQNLIGSRLTRGDLLVKYMLMLLTSTGIFMPILYNMDILRNPCFPLYLGYWLSSSCDSTNPGVAFTKSGWSALEIGTRIGISFLSYFNWSMLLVGACFLLSLELNIQAHCLRRYNSLYGKKLAKATRVDNRVRKATLSYRQIQLMSHQYRLNYSQFMIGIVIPSIMIIEVICLYNTVSLFSGNDQGGSLGYNLLYGWCGMICFLGIVFVCGILADVHKVSSKVQTGVKGNYELKRSKWFRRWLRSSQAIRIYVWGPNYMNQLTPMTLEIFVINQTASMLLLKS